jgi:hypothetical protein
VSESSSVSKLPNLTVRGTSVIPYLDKSFSKPIEPESDGLTVFFVYGALDKFTVFDTEGRIYIRGPYVEVGWRMFIAVDVYTKTANAIDKLAHFNEPEFAVDLLDSTLAVK